MREFGIDFQLDLYVHMTLLLRT